MKKFNLVKNYREKKKQERQLSKLTRYLVIFYVALIIGFGGTYLIKYLNLDTINNSINELSEFVNDPSVKEKIEEINKLQGKKITMNAAIQEISIIKDKVRSLPVVTSEAYLGFANQGSFIKDINYSEGIMDLQIVTNNNTLPSLIAKELKNSNLYKEVNYFGFTYDKNKEYYIASYTLLLKGGN